MQHLTRKVLSLFSFLIITSFLLLSCTEVPEGSDLSVGSIEITQGLQTSSNSIPLIAQRSTAVRVTVNTGGNVPISGISGTLRVFVNGTEITPANGIIPINAPFTASPNPSRAVENDTLNFEIPAPTGIGASSNVDFQVDLVRLGGDSDESNNRGELNNLTFIATDTPSLFFSRIDYTPAGAGPPALSSVQAGVGDSFVKGIYPVNDADPNLYRQGLFPTLPFSIDPDLDDQLDGNFLERDVLLSMLASSRQMMVFFGQGPSSQTFLYGWVANNPINGNGWAPLGGRVAFGNTQFSRHQRTFAHELGHNFGLDHNSRSIAPDLGWDITARLENNPAANNTTGRLKGSSLNDIMRGGQLTNSAWVDEQTYISFLANPVLTTALKTAQEKPSERVLVVQGAMTEKGDALAFLEPSFRFPWPSEPIPGNPEGEFLLELIDDQEKQYNKRFNAFVGDDEGEAPGIGEPYGFFEVMLPVPAEREVNSLRILDRQGKALVELNRTQAPKLALTEPKVGATLGEQSTVSWEFADPDSELSELQFQVAYSPDGGSSWVPVALDISGETQSIRFDSTEIQRSSGEGIIRVFLSDGLNTVFADVSGLSSAAASFE